MAHAVGAQARFGPEVFARKALRALVFQVRFDLAQWPTLCKR